MLSYSVLCPLDELNLHIAVKRYKIGVVSRYPHKEVAVILRVRHSVFEHLRSDHIQLYLHTAQIKVCFYIGEHVIHCLFARVARRGTTLTLKAMLLFRFTGSSFATSRILSSRLFEAKGCGVRPGVKGLPDCRPEGSAPVSVPKATWVDMDQNPVVYFPPR